MKELGRGQRAKLDQLHKAVAEEEPKLAAAIGEYNATVKAAHAKLEGLIGGSTRARDEFDRFQSAIVDAMTQFVGESPEDWQEGEEGQGYLEWCNAWLDAAVFPLDVKRPPELKAPQPALSAIIAALPLDPGEVEKTSGGPAGPDLSLDQLRSTTIRDDWARIADFARRTFPEGAFRLAEGATQGQIDAAEAILGFTLPEDVRESYRAHNGSDETSFVILGELSSIEVVARDFARRRSWSEEGWGTPDEIEGPIRRVWWDTSRVQLTESGSGDGLTIDLNPAEGGTWGQVIHHDHERGPTRVYARSWGEFLRMIADEAEAGKIVHDEDYTWGHLKGWVFDPPLSATAAPAGAVEKTTAGGARETAAKRHFEFIAGTSNKFWEVVQEGSEMTARYGKIGTNGQSSTKSYDNPEKAAAETAKIIARKIKEGYVEKSS